MIEVRKYQKGDIFREAPWRVIPTKTLDAQFLNSISFSMFVRADIILSMGVDLIAPGVGQTFTIMNDRVNSYPLGVPRNIKHALKIFGAYHSLRKVYAMIDDSSIRDKRWIKWLGFTEEYRMLNILPDGSDLVGYVQTLNTLQKGD